MTDRHTTPCAVTPAKVSTPMADIFNCYEAAEILYDEMRRQPSAGYFTHLVDRAAAALDALAGVLDMVCDLREADEVDASRARECYNTISQAAAVIEKGGY